MNVREMVVESKRKKKSVPSVTEPKPENVKPPETEAPINYEPTQVAIQETPAAPSVEAAPQKLIEIPPIDPDTKKMLAKAGVNWDSVTQAFEKVNIWAESVDARFNVILQKMPTEKGIADELIKRAEEKQKQMQAQAQGSSGNQGAAIGIPAWIGPVLDKVMSSSGSNPLMEKYVDALITRNMNEMVEATTFDKIMREYFVKKMSKELGEPLMSTTPKAGA